MAYQVIARKWRPQRFDDVVGQKGVTQTLRNAIEHDRLAQSFVFAGPRGVGKTTTARILARALNCVTGATADPCGDCDACREIADGRDIDVLEIDAATHTQVENIREVIIAGLAIQPVRDRYKVFIIDEVHQLSGSSFNALLKSVEEPPPHVVFIMATTLLDKIPDTILSRSQVFEFRTIGTAAITEQLRTIADTEGVTIDAAALALLARAADGSMRDAQSALDQVIAFAGESVSVAEAASVLGLVGRDTVFDIAETVADETAPRVFELAGRFVESGYDFRAVCRELTRLVRDLLVLKVDPRRLTDPEIAADQERDRLQALATRFSREDLLRGFDVLSRAEFEIRSAAQPRYHFEMAMLRWMHLRKLVPLAELVDGLEQSPAPAPRNTPTPASGEAPAPPEKASAAPPRRSAPAVRSKPAEQPASATPSPEPAAPMPGDPKGAFLGELKRTKKFFYGTVVAQAQRIEVAGAKIVFTYTETQRTLADQVGTSRSWLEALAAKTIGRKMVIAVNQVAEATPAATTSPAESPPKVDPQPATLESSSEPPPPTEPPGDLDLLQEEPYDPAVAPVASRPATAKSVLASPVLDSPVQGDATTQKPARALDRPVVDGPADDLFSQAMGDKAVQNMLEVLPAEIKDVEEI
ncbi:MAG TPA: DNA polymerase III subunit gamma/tau [Acidobacteria bacterium]|nr:DNA polymerase III subunit gamma/tau [Acidobacteriota bacterium]